MQICSSVRDREFGVEGLLVLVLFIALSSMQCLFKYVTSALCGRAVAAEGTEIFLRLEGAFASFPSAQSLLGSSEGDFIPARRNAPL